MKRRSLASHIVFTERLRVEIDERELRDPLPNEILLQTKYTLISTGTELTVLRGQHTPGSVWSNLFAYPWDAGYCNVAIVLQTGALVTRFKTGDRVASTGPHASRFVIVEDDCLLIPEEVSDDAAVFATIAQIVMQGVRQARIGLGENVVVCGLGLLGQLTIAFARHVGAWPLIGVDLEGFRRQLATEMGATEVAAPENAREIISECTDQRMADVVFEVTGNPAAIPKTMEWVRTLGRFVIVSSPTGPTTLDFHDLVNAKGTIVIGAHNYTHASVANEYNRWTRSVDTAYYLLLAKAGLIATDKLITHRFSWREAPEAYGQLLNDRASTLGVLLEWID